MGIFSDNKVKNGLCFLIILLNLVNHSEEKVKGILEEITHVAVAEISMSSEQHADVKPLKLGKVLSMNLKNEDSIFKVKLILTLVPIYCNGKSCLKERKYCDAEVHMKEGSEFVEFKHSNCTHEKVNNLNNSTDFHEINFNDNKSLGTKQTQTNVYTQEDASNTAEYKYLSECVSKQLGKHTKYNIMMKHFHVKSEEKYAKGFLTVMSADIIKICKKRGNIDMKCNITVYSRNPPLECQLLQFSCTKAKNESSEEHTTDAAKNESILPEFTRKVVPSTENIMNNTHENATVTDTDYSDSKRKEEHSSGVTRNESMLSKITAEIVSSTEKSVHKVTRVPTFDAEGSMSDEKEEHKTNIKTKPSSIEIIPTTEDIEAKYTEDMQKTVKPAYILSSLPHI